MASWLKAAEDLFEVVDRRAKKVVTDHLVEEQSDSLSGPSPAVNRKGPQNRRTKSKTKAQKKESAKDSTKSGDNAREKSSTQASQPDSTPDKDNAGPSIESEVITKDKNVAEESSELELHIDKDATSNPSSEPPANDMVKHDEHVEAPVTVVSVDATASTSSSELLNEKAPDVSEQPPSTSSAKEIELVSEDSPADARQEIKAEYTDITPKTEQEKPQSEVIDSPLKTESQAKDAELKVETLGNQNEQEQKADTSEKVQDQLEEAQGLLKTAASTGPSKEARLARVCAGLSNRLQEYKSENAQLEELLVSERELSKSYEAHIKQLQQDLSISKSEVTKVESNMVEALAAKNSEIEALVSSMDALKKQAALSEGSLASMQANMESLMRNRELTETMMMQALREELSSAERRAEEERAAHNATKMAAMDREMDLERRAIDASTALAKIQRVADERTSKAAELEQKVALLEVECASINQELQDMEVRCRREQKKAPDEANQIIQMQAWQEEVERARQGQRDAESKLSTLEVELQKVRVEMAAMKRDAERFSRQEHMELEKRYRELTDLLYYKQTQLETMASDKAAAEFQLEKELKRHKEAQLEAERTKVPRRRSSYWDEETEMKALEPLPIYHRHMATATIQLQKAAKWLDSGAVRATRFLWRYPTARVLLLVYLIFVHLFLMYLLHRLQEQAANFSDREIAESMGLNTTLP